MNRTAVIKAFNFLLINILISFNADASIEIKLLAYDIPSILQQDKQGEYDQLFKRVNAELKQNWTYNIAPPARVDKMFESKRVDCIIPFEKSFHPLKETINSLPLNIAEARIYSLSEEATSISWLKGKTVGARTGMLYGAEFDNIKKDKKTYISLVGKVEQNVEKLLSKRIDAFVAWSPDVERAVTEKKITLSRSKPFLTHNDAFLCHDTPKSRAFIALFNRGLNKVKQLNDSQ